MVKKNQKHTFREWLEATRYWSFPVSTMPVVVTCAYLFWQGGGAEPFNGVNALLALAGVVLFHAAGNVLSDYFDFKTGVDSEQAYAVPNLVQHRFEAGEYLLFSSILFAAGLLVGLLLTLLGGWPLLLIGGAGFLLGVLFVFALRDTPAGTSEQTQPGKADDTGFLSGMKYFFKTPTAICAMAVSRSRGAVLPPKLQLPME